MIKLNLPEFDFKIKKEDNKQFIFDDIRKKYILLTPEEWVRQNFIKYLVNYKEYPASLISVESALKINKLQKRSDIIIYSKKGEPVIIIECKAPEVKISQKTFDQVSLYNYNLKVSYLIITNGLSHYCCEINYTTGSYKFINKIPGYSQLS